MREKKKALVIFDLDETLLHSRQEWLDREPDYVLDRLAVYFRPNALKLIEAVAKKFEIGVWSAGSPLYVDSIVERMFGTDVKPLFVWNRDHCTAKFEFSYFQTLFLKDLNKMGDFGFDLTSTLIIEDDPVKVRDFARNALFVSQYFGDEADDELSALVDYIDGLNGHHDDVREIGKIWNDKKKKKRS
jgi:RNA polymerase II subunit A small phosphatase-like protein